MEEIKQNINFLDVKIIVENNQLITDLYQKPTDSQQYVHFKSCHPPHTKRNIPFNLARRYCTIIEKETSKEQHLLNLKSTLLKLDYPRNLIQHSIQQAKKIPLEELRSPKEHNTEKQPLAFVTTFNPRNFDIFKVIKETISMLDASPQMKRGMSKFNLINSKRQPANIKQILSRVKDVELVQLSWNATKLNLKDLKFPSE